MTQSRRMNKRGGKFDNALLRKQKESGCLCELVPHCTEKTSAKIPFLSFLTEYQSNNSPIDEPPTETFSH